MKEPANRADLLGCKKIIARESVTKHLPVLRTILQIIDSLPEGYSEGLYLGSQYGIVKETFNSGKSFKVYARELGGNNFISLNYYVTKKEEFLRPCEIPSEKVIHFLRELRDINQI